VEQHLWLIGMMGSGKTATAGELARRWDAPLVDVDAEVTARTGCSIARLWGERGEKAFREMETAAVLRLVDAPASVISTGGGVVLDPKNVTAMRRSGRVVWLSAPPRVLAARVGDGSGRPLLATAATEERLDEILAERADLYAAAAHDVVDSGAATIKETADRIEALWNRS
jgi:shikimate kinase